MDNQRWMHREHLVRSEDGIDLHFAVEPVSASDRMGNRAKMSGNERTARLTLYFNELSCGEIFGDTFVFEGVPISSMMELHDKLSNFFSRPVIKEEMERILVLRKLERLEADLRTISEQDQGQ